MMELEKNIHEGSQSQSEKEREIMLQKSQIQEMRRQQKLLDFLFISFYFNFSLYFSMNFHLSF